MFDMVRYAHELKVTSFSTANFGVAIKKGANPLCINKNVVAGSWTDNVYMRYTRPESIFNMRNCFIQRKCLLLFAASRISIIILLAKTNMYRSNQYEQICQIYLWGARQPLHSYSLFILILIYVTDWIALLCAYMRIGHEMTFRAALSAMRGRNRICIQNSNRSLIRTRTLISFPIINTKLRYFGKQIDIIY